MYTTRQKEIESLILTTKKGITIFPYNKILFHVLTMNNLTVHFLSLIDKDITIKILTDRIGNLLINSINEINNSDSSNPVRQGYSDKLGDLNEMVIISDNKRLLNIEYNQENKLVGIFSNAEQNILVQEILFEKYWNEIKSLSIMQNN